MTARTGRRLLLLAFLAVSPTFPFSVSMSGWIWGDKGVPKSGAVVRLASGGPSDTVRTDGTWKLEFQSGESLGQSPLVSARVVRGVLWVATSRTTDLDWESFDARGSRSVRGHLSGLNGYSEIPVGTPGVSGHVSWIRLRTSDGASVVLGSTGPMSRIGRIAPPRTVVDSLILEVPDSASRWAIPVGTWDLTGLSLVLAPGWNPLVPHGLLVDSRDGKTYQTIHAGAYEWMAENLRYVSATGSSCPVRDSCGTYGMYYSWAGADGACPSGWRLPALADWDSLGTFLIRSGVRQVDLGWTLKSSVKWAFRSGGSDPVGFRSLPAGFIGVDGSWHDRGETANFWTADPFSRDSSWVVVQNWSDSALGLIYDRNATGLSVRCVRP